MIAFIDAAGHEPSRTYVFAASLVPEDEAAALQADLVQTLRPAQRRFHWHRESREVRLTMLAVIGGFNIEHWVEVSRPVRARDEYPYSRPWVFRGGNGRWDLARGASLQRFVSRHTLEAAVHELVITSRGDTQDRKDRLNLTDPRATAWGKQRQAPPSYRFVTPALEPLLWIPDSIAGAVLALYGRGDGEYLDRVPAWRPRGLRRRRTRPLGISLRRW